MLETTYLRLSRQKFINPKADVLEHYILGLCCEYLEFMKALAAPESVIENLEEEFGDFLWYGTQAKWWLGVDIHWVDLEPITGLIEGEPNEELEYLLSETKAVLYYGRPFRDYGRLWFNIRLLYCRMLNRMQDVDIGRLMDLNYCKLSRRYPLGFTPEAAITRLDKGSADGE